jgi:hypothetical protein
MTRARIMLLSTLVFACQRGAEPTHLETDTQKADPAEPEPEHHLIRHACRGFDAALAEGTPNGRLLSATAKHAIALGGPEVEAATKRWALLPPQELLELIDRYETEAQPDLQQCAGLRAHLEQMAERLGTH